STAFSVIPRWCATLGWMRCEGSLLSRGCCTKRTNGTTRAPRCLSRGAETHSSACARELSEQDGPSPARSFETELIDRLEKQFQAKLNLSAGVRRADNPEGAALEEARPA